MALPNFTVSAKFESRRFFCQIFVAPPPEKNGGAYGAEQLFGSWWLGEDKYNSPDPSEHDGGGPEYEVIGVRYHRGRIVGWDTGWKGGPLIQRRGMGNGSSAHLVPGSQVPRDTPTN